MYWLTVHAWLQQRGAPVIRVLNPLQTRAFRNADLRGVRRDRVDAVSVARLLRWEGSRLATHTSTRRSSSPAAGRGGCA